MNNTIILGGGISGIAAGYFLGNNIATIYESNNYYGGLCNSFSINNFIFDTAVHFSFSNNEIVRKIFDKTEYFSHKPDSYNYYKGYWLKHPVQNNLYNLNIDEKIKCITDFVNRPNQNNDINNYEQWLYGQYGKYIAEEFPIKYTRKYWCAEAKELSVNWINNRMYRPNLEEVLRGSMTDETPNTYYAKEMRYPKFGGYMSYIKPMVENVDIRLNKKATCIDINNRYVEFADGTKEYYENLISSIPINEVVKLIKDTPSNILEAAQKLMVTSVALVSVGFKRPDVAKYLWYYIYDEDILPARVYSPSLKSINNVPDNCSSLQFEIYFSENKQLHFNEKEVLEKIESDILKMNLCDKNDILFMDYRKIKYGNVIFYKDMGKYRKIVTDYLNKCNIVSIGRFGKWDYLWSDQSLLSGKNAADNLLASR